MRTARTMLWSAPSERENVARAARPHPWRSRGPCAKLAAPAWPAALLAGLAITGCGVGGANDGLLGALLASAEFIVATMILASQPMPAPALRQVGPVLVLLGALLVWAALPTLAQTSAGGWFRNIAPPLSPDIYPLGLAELAGTIVLFIAAAVVGMGRAQRRRVVVWLTGLGSLLVAVTLALRLLGAPPGLALEDERMHRFAGTIGNANAAGVIYAMLALLAMGLALSSLARWRLRPTDKRLVIFMAEAIVALAGLAMVGLTLSRTALLLLLVGEALLIAAQVLAGKATGSPVWWRRLGLTVAAGGALVGIMASATLDRLAPVGTDSLDRAGIWSYYWGLARQAPLAGYGLGSFIEVNQRHLTPAHALAYWSFGAAHAAPLQLALEMGWPGLLLMAALVVVVMGTLLRRIDLARDPIGAAMVLAVLVALVASMVDIALTVPGIAALSVTLAGVAWGRSLRGRPIGKAALPVV